MAMESENQYEPPVRARPITRPMTIPVLPHIEPIPTHRAARRVSMKVVLMVLRSIRPSWCRIRLRKKQELD
jgi:hypothetical protein